MKLGDDNERENFISQAHERTMGASDRISWGEMASKYPGGSNFAGTDTRVTA